MTPQTWVGLAVVAAAVLFVLFALGVRRGEKRTLMQSFIVLAFRWARFWTAYAMALDVGLLQFRESKADMKIRLRTEEVEA